MGRNEGVNKFKTIVQQSGEYGRVEEHFEAKLTESLSKIR